MTINCHFTFTFNIPFIMLLGDPDSVVKSLMQAWEGCVITRVLPHQKLIMYIDTPLFHSLPY